MFIFGTITKLVGIINMADLEQEKSDREEIITEMGKHNVLEKIVEELSRLIEKKEYDRALSRN